MFFRWCLRNGVVSANTAAALRDHDSPLRGFRRVYGRQQAKYPGRWLTYDEAFGVLLGTCAAGTDHDLRDEIALRLGLLGLRASEIGRLQVGSVRIDGHSPLITWTGKSYKPRKVVPGERLIACLRDYLGRYERAIGRPLTADDRLICQQVKGTHGKPRLAWGSGFSDPRQQVYKLVLARADKARLGHVATHDLRRTAAGILHTSRDANGKHDFDLLDIQQVLGHSDPAITMRAYLEPMDTGIIQRAALFLD